MKDTEYQQRVEHEARNIAEETLSGKYGDKEAAEYIHDIFGSMSDSEMVIAFKDNFEDLRYMMTKKVAGYQHVMEKAEQRVIQEDKYLLADGLTQRAKEDRWDAEQAAREAEEAAHATKYNGVD